MARGSPGGSHRNAATVTPPALSKSTRVASSAVALAWVVLIGRRPLVGAVIVTTDTHPVNDTGAHHRGPRTAR